jgi:hypothetical protein
MDDFRVDSISPYDLNRRQQPPDAVKRRKEKPAENQEPEAAEDIVTASDPSAAETAEEPVQDYYEPSGPPEE